MLSARRLVDYWLSFSISASYCVVNGLAQFAEILPRFISKLMSLRAHKRIFFRRDPLLYWLYALHEAGAGVSQVFITPRSSVRVRPPLPIESISYSHQRR